MRREQAVEGFVYTDFGANVDADSVAEAVVREIELGKAFDVRKTQAIEKEGEGRWKTAVYALILMAIIIGTALGLRCMASRGTPADDKTSGSTSDKEE